MDSIQFSNMTEKEVKAVADAAKARLNDIQAEKDKLKARKLAYAMVTPEVEYTYNYHMMWLTLMEELNLLPISELTIERLNQIEKRYTDIKGVKYGNVYPCPECGHMSLEVGLYGDLYPEDKMAIYCGHCSFQMKPKRQGRYDSWTSFHDWLIKNHYLGNDVKML